MDVGQRSSEQDDSKNVKIRVDVAEFAENEEKKSKSDESSLASHPIAENYATADKGEAKRAAARPPTITTTSATTAGTDGLAEECTFNESTEEILQFNEHVSEVNCSKGRRVQASQECEQEIESDNDQKCPDEDVQTTNEDMNYFRNKFVHRSRPLSSGNDAHSAESYLRDLRSRRRRAFSQNRDGSPSGSRFDHGYRLKTSSASLVDKYASKPDEDPAKVPLRWYAGDPEPQPVETVEVSFQLPPPPTRPSIVDRILAESGHNEERRRSRSRWGSDSDRISPKPSSFRRRRREKPPPVQETQEETKPVEVQVSGQDDVDPLSFVEIKSAAQWKAMSEKVSWNFDDEQAAKLEPIEDKGTVKKVSRRDHITYDLSKVNFPPDPSGFAPTKVQQLRLVCWRLKPWNVTRTNAKLFTSQFGIPWGVDCDEVHPGLFIGDKASASTVPFLTKYGITHVLNTAEGREEGLVDLSQEHYAGTNIRYMGFPLWDSPDCNILPYFGCAADFVESALNGGGKCLVNCQMGVSRSASCAMAFLMIKQGFTSVEALTILRKGRDCRPNDGKCYILLPRQNVS